jgi:hypothetical protein
MTSYKERPWAAFHGGKWVKEHPSVPGLYYVADRDGTVRGMRRWETNAFGRLVEVDRPQGERWMGWVWSHPVPDAPNLPVPPWDPKENVQ